MSPSSLALLVLLAALWGGSFVFMRVAAPALGPLPLAYARVALAAMALLALAIAQRRVPPLRTRWREFAVLGVVNSAAAVRAVQLRRAAHPRVDGGDPQCHEPVLRGTRRGACGSARRSRWRKIAGMAVGLRGGRNARGVAPGVTHDERGACAGGVSRRCALLRARQRVRQAQARRRAEHRGRLREPDGGSGGADAARCPSRPFPGPVTSAGGRQRPRPGARVDGAGLRHLLQAHRRRGSAARHHGDVPHPALRRAVGLSVPGRAGHRRHARRGRAWWSPARRSPCGADDTRRRNLATMSPAGDDADAPTARCRRPGPGSARAIRDSAAVAADRRRCTSPARPAGSAA